MNSSRYRWSLIVCAYLASVACEMGGFVSTAGAQNAVQATADKSISATVPMTSSAEVFTDGELETRVKGALHAAPYFYDEHVTVSVEHGAVILGGIVFSDSDLADAIRIASKVAGGRRVVNNLSIELGGRR
jgi:osmotically-inducible protein OsmY